MKRLSVLVIFLSLFIFIRVVGAQTPTSTPRFAACDLCGYCPPSAPPSTWESCRQCLYPSASSDPNAKDTLIITDLTTNIPPTPYPGHQYTMLGCVGTNLGSFRQEGAAGSVVQTLLNIIFSVVGGLSFISLIYGSFIIMTSQANPERLNQGKKIVYGAIAGVIFALSSVFLVRLIASGILRIPGFTGTTP